ncbi:MAG: lysophospholipid acyltransferase family protein [Myxococcota bacterium]
MLDAQTLRKVKLNRVPFGQKVVAWGFLFPNYALPRKTEIEVEGLDNLPDRSVVLAMNHTDRYNYWPFQYQMYRFGVPRFTATWVKGKYYENAMMSWFMMSMNTIPVPSRGYIIAARFQEAIGRAPSNDEYRLLRDLVDGARSPDAIDDELSADLARFVAAYGKGEGASALPSVLERFEAEFDEVMGEVVRLNQEAMFKYDNNILIFPEGTRSPTLSTGRTGLAQMAQHLGATIVPVGCSGSDTVYPGNSPVARGGRIVYRIGKPLEPHGDELRNHRVTEPFVPLSRQASERHHAKFQAITDCVMERINALIDPKYRFAEESSVSEQGVKRFL